MELFRLFIAPFLVAACVFSSTSSYAGKKDTKDSTCSAKVEDMAGPRQKYIHAAGDLAVERQRLKDQAEMLRADIWRGIDLSNLPQANTAPFLEVGSGVAGQTPHLLNALPPGTSLVGIDIDPSQVAHAVANMERDFPALSQRCSFQAMDAKKMLFGDNSMSGAYVSWVLEHMSRQDAIAVLRELRRVVRTGGVIVLNEVHLDVDTSWLIQRPDQKARVAPNSKKFLEAMIREQQESQGDPNVGSPDSMKDLLAKAGFSTYQYQRLTMHYDQGNPHTLNAYAHYLKALWKSVLPDLIKSGKITQADFELVEKELFEASVLRQEAGQVIIYVD